MKLIKNRMNPKNSKGQVKYATAFYKINNFFSKKRQFITHYKKNKKLKKSTENTNYFLLTFTLRFKNEIIRTN